MPLASKYRRQIGLWITIPCLLLLGSCNSVKYVPENKYLLNSVTIKVDNKDIKTDELKGYIKQKANRRILGFRFHLGLYNLSNLEKEKGFSKYLRTIGEEPSIWEPYASVRATDQLKLYLDKKGYYNSIVIDSVHYRRRKKVDLFYLIKANEPYTIRNIRYFLDDTGINKIFYADTINTFIKRKNNIDRDVLENERFRLEYLFRDRGYFNFSKDYIFIDIDTSFNNKADLFVRVKNSEVKRNNRLFSSPHQTYVIRNVMIVNENVPDYVPEKGEDINKEDTVFSNGVQFLYHQGFSVKPSVILQSCYMVPGYNFSISDVEETRKHLYSLNVFSIVDVQFTEVPPSDTLSKNFIDCKIRLVPVTMQSNTLEIEGTNSSGNLGFAINMVYQHRSLLGNAEAFNLKLRWAMEAIKKTEINQLSKTIEYGAEASLNLPKFLLPINSIKFVKKYNPKTSITIGYNFQQRPDFTRTLANVSFGYHWRQDRHKTHSFIPVELNFVDIPNKSDRFKEIIDSTYLEKVYSNHMVTSTRYTYIYNNQNIKKNTDFTYLKFNFEPAGNILSVFNWAFDRKRTDGYFTFFSNRYSQFLLMDVDYRYYDILTPGNSIVYRLFAGAAYPYGNADVVPFEKQYSSGGANSIRGWQVRTLGPGSYKDLISPYPNSTGDIKLEANIEYRFKLFGIFHGALFTDVGNIWLIRKVDNADQQNTQNLDKTLFKFDKFVSDLAVGSGLGFRFDFKFFVFRTDLGLKMRDPSRDSNKWIFTQKHLLASDFALSIAINYPF